MNLLVIERMYKIKRTISHLMSSLFSAGISYALLILF